MYSTYMWYTYIKQLQIFYWICKMIIYVNNYNIVFISILIPKILRSETFGKSLLIP